MGRVVVDQVIELRVVGVVDEMLLLTVVVDKLVQFMLADLIMFLA
jgi:hypothetical protein